MAKVRKGKLFSLFEKDFKITFFYKPTLVPNDMMYCVILDDTIQLHIRVFNNIVLVIHDIIPMTDAYLSKYYDKFIKFLINQTMFTVLISRFGNTTCVADACIKMNVPTVEDTRFITISQNLYDMYKKRFDDVNKYGFYLLAVTDELGEIKDAPKPIAVDVIQPPKKETVVNSVPDCPISPMVNHLSNTLRSCKINVHQPQNTTDTIVEINSGVTLYVTLVDEDIHINDITLSPTASLVELMSIFESLEMFPTTIYIEDIKDINVFKLCQVRKYEKIVNMAQRRRARADRFGTYKITKL